jgi:hypothetical protein
MVVAMIGFGVLQTVNAARQREANRALAAAKSKLEESNTELERANINLLAAKTESDTSYSLAVEALRNIVERFTNQLFGVPLAEQVMQATMGDSAELYRKLTELRPADRELAARYAAVLIRKASFELYYSKFDAALKSQVRAGEFLQTRLKRDPSDPELLLAQVNLDVAQANVYNVLGRVSELAAARKQFIEHSASFCERFPGHPECSTLKFQRFDMEASTARDENDLVGQLESQKKATAVAREYFQQHPQNHSAFIRLHTSIYLLGFAHQICKEYVEADRSYAELETLLKKARIARPNDTNLKNEVAEAMEARGNIAEKLHEPLEAGKLYRGTEPMRRELVLLFPTDPNQKIRLANNLAMQAHFEADTDPKSAIRKLDEAIAISGKLAKEYPKNDIFTLQDGKWRGWRKELDEGK